MEQHLYCTPKLAVVVAEDGNAIRVLDDAFAALIWRHGPLVWRVCCRVLRHAHQAEEAYQATFLVLARQAAKVHKPAALASFLYGVAFRIARKARADLPRRQSPPREPIAERLFP